MAHMKTITGMVYGREYTLACDVGQERHLQNLVTQLNQRAIRLESAIGKLPENLMLLYTALMVADELHESQKEVAKLNEELAQARRLLEHAGTVNSNTHQLEEAVAANLFEVADRLSAVANKLAA
jgi:cell division protein ZapA